MAQYHNFTAGPTIYSVVDCIIKSFKFESHCLGLSSLEPDSDTWLKVKEFIWQVKGMLAGEYDIDTGRPTKGILSSQLNDRQ